MGKEKGSVKEIEQFNSKLKKKCEMCEGYGWWPYGDLSPLGRIDGGEMSDISIKCPWCKKGKRDKGERYNKLVEYKVATQ
jgi:hypothetical protein